MYRPAFGTWTGCYIGQMEYDSSRSVPGMCKKRSCVYLPPPARHTNKHSQHREGELFPLHLVKDVLRIEHWVGVFCSYTVEVTVVYDESSSSGVSELLVFDHFRPLRFVVR